MEESLASALMIQKAGGDMEEQESKADGLVSASEATINLVNCTVGSAVLALPHCFRASGTLLGVVILVFCGVLSRFSLKCLLYCGERSGKRTYEDVCDVAYGRKGRILVNACIAMLQIGALVAYVNIVSDVLSSVAGTIIPPGAEPSRGVVMTGVTMLVLMPCALLVTNAQALAAVSMGSIAVVGVFTVAMIHMGLTRLDFSHLDHWRPDGLLISFPVMVFGFANHVAVFPIYSQLRSPSMTKMTKVVESALCVAFAIYFGVGISGYMAFGEGTAGDLLRNLGGGDGYQAIYERVLKLGYGASIVGTVPVVVLPIQETFLPLIFPPPAQSSPGAPPHKPTVLQGYMVTAGLFGVALASAILIPNVEFIFALVGATSSVTLAYILPATLFLHFQPVPGSELVPATDPASRAHARQEVFRRRLSGAMLVFGVCAMVACTSATLGAVKEEADVVLLAQELAAKGAAASEAVAISEAAEAAAGRVETALDAEAALRGVQRDAVATLDTVSSAGQELTKKQGKSNKKSHDDMSIGESLVQRLKDMQSAREAIKGAKATTGVLVGLKDSMNKTRSAMAVAAEAARMLGAEPELFEEAARAGAGKAELTEGGILAVLESVLGMEDGDRDSPSTALLSAEAIKKKIDARLDGLGENADETLSAINNLAAALEAAHNVSERIGGTQPIRIVHYKEQAKLTDMEHHLSSALREAVDASTTAAQTVNRTLEDLQEATATAVADIVEKVYRARGGDGAAAAGAKAGGGEQQAVATEPPPAREEGVLEKAIESVEDMIKEEVEWATGGGASASPPASGASSSSSSPPASLDGAAAAWAEAGGAGGGADDIPGAETGKDILEAAWKEMLTSTSAVVKNEEFNTSQVVQAAVAVAKESAQDAIQEVEAAKEAAKESKGHKVASRAEQIAALLGKPAAAGGGSSPLASSAAPSAAAGGEEQQAGGTSLSSLYNSLQQDNSTGNWTLTGVDDAKLAAALGRSPVMLVSDIQTAGTRKAKGSLTLQELWSLLTGTEVPTAEANVAVGGGGGGQPGGGEQQLPGEEEEGPKEKGEEDERDHEGKDSKGRDKAVAGPVVSLPKDRGKKQHEHGGGGAEGDEGGGGSKRSRDKEGGEGEEKEEEEEIPEDRNIGAHKLGYRDNKEHQHVHESEEELAIPGKPKPKEEEEEEKKEKRAPSHHVHSVKTPEIVMDEK